MNNSCYLIFTLIGIILLMSGCLYKMNKRVVDPAPFDLWVRESLAENGITTESTSKISYAAFSHVSVLPNVKGKVYSDHCVEVHIYGIHDDVIISKISDLVSSKVKNKLEHRAVLSFFYDNNHRKLMRRIIYPQ